MIDTTTNALVSSISAVQNTAGLTGGGIYVRKQSAYIGFAGAHFEGNMCTLGSGGALYVDDSCSYISIGGLQPLLQTVPIASSGSTPIIKYDKTITGGVGFTALGFFVTFPTQASNIITYCSDHAFVGTYKYGRKPTGDGSTCAQEFLDPTTPGVQGEPPYRYTSNFMNVNMTHFPNLNNPYITCAVFPYARYDGSGAGYGPAGATFEGNTAAMAGGALHVQSSVTHLFVMPGTTFRGNIALSSGGAVYVNDTNVGLYFYSTTFTDNHAGLGGAVHLYNQNSAVQFTDCSFTLNTAQNGGAVYLGTGNGNGMSLTVTTNIVRFDNTTMMYNTADFYGGAVYADFLNSFTFNRSRLMYNRAMQHGGAVFMSQSNRPVALINTTVERNQAVGGSGGAVYVDTSLNGVELQSTSLSFNTAGAMGGAMAFMAYNTLDITAGSCLFTSNRAVGGFGGAVYVSASAVVVGPSTVSFTNNSAESGSALYLSSSSTASFTLSNSSQKVRNSPTVATKNIMLFNPPMKIGPSFSSFLVVSNLVHVYHHFHTR